MPGPFHCLGRGSFARYRCVHGPSPRRNKKWETRQEQISSSSWCTSLRTQEDELLWKHFSQCQHLCGCEIQNKSFKIKLHRNTTLPYSLPLLHSISLFVFLQLVRVLWVTVEAVSHPAVIWRKYVDSTLETGKGGTSNSHCPCGEPFLPLALYALFWHRLWHRFHSHLTMCWHPLEKHNNRIFL